MNRVNQNVKMTSRLSFPGARQPDGARGKDASRTAVCTTSYHEAYDMSSLCLREVLVNNKKKQKQIWEVDYMDLVYTR